MAQVNTALNLSLDGESQGQLVTVTDSTADDSDKTITVPDGKIWDIVYLNATLVASADVGNRQIRVLVKNAAGTEVYRQNSAAVQVASATEFYHFNPRLGTVAETVATFHTIPLLTALLPSGFTIQISDSAAIAAAADDLTISGLVVEYDGR